MPSPATISVAPINAKASAGPTVGIPPVPMRDGGGLAVLGAF